MASEIARVEGQGREALSLDKQVTLEDWLKSISHSEDHGVLTAVKAHHWVQANGGFAQGPEIVGRQYQQDKSWSPKEEAALIRGRCQQFSQELPGTQTFRLYAYFGQEEAAAFHHISCNGRAMMEGGLTETPDARGMTTQGMAMGNLVVSRSFGMQSETWKMMVFLMTELKGERDFYAKEARDGATIVNEMMREKVLENHKQRMAELQFQRATGERAKLIQLLPAILRYLTKGKEMIPEGMADTAILKSAATIIRKMPDDDKIKTLSALPPELMMILGDRLQELSTEQEKEEAAIELLSKAKTAEDAESDRSLAEEILTRAGALSNGSAKKPQLPSS